MKQGVCPVVFVLCFALFTLAGPVHAKPKGQMLLNAELIGAVTSGHVRKAIGSIARGAEVNVAKDKNGQAALHIAAWTGNVEIARILVENGADVNIKDRGGETPLHIASYYGKADMVRFLLENGAKVGARKNNGATPLHDAAIIGRADVARLLIENGADVNARANDGLTPYAYARLKRSESLMSLLKENGADEWNPAPPKINKRRR